MTTTQRKISRINNWKPEEENIIVNVILAEVTMGNTLQKAYSIATEKVNKAFGNSRTFDGVAFRWTSVLKPNYIQEFEKAKAEGKKHRIKNGSSSLLTPKTAPQQQSLPLKEEKDEVTEFIKNTPVNEVTQLQIEEKAELQPKPEVAVAPKTKTVKSGSTDEMLESLEVLKSFVENSSNLHLQLELANTELAFAQGEVKKSDEKYSLLEKKYDTLQKKYETLEEDYNAILKLIDRARKLTVDEENEQQEKSSACRFKMEPNGNLIRR